MISTVQDLARPNEAEGALPEAEERYRLLVEHSPDGVLIHQDLICVYVNRACVALLGATRPEELLGRSVLDIVRPDFREAVRERIRLQVEEGKMPPLMEQTYLRPDGSTVQVEVSAAPCVFRGKAAVQAIARDITERKRAEDALRQFRAAMDISPDLILLIDRASMRFVDVNSTACRVLGYRREELLALGPHDVAPVSREELAQLYDRVIAGDTSVSTVEMHHRRKDGSLVPVELFRRAVPSRDGHIIVIIARDITERNQAQEMLRKSEARFRGFVEQSPDAMIIHQAGRIIFANDAMVRLLRVGDTGALLGKPGLSLVHAAHADIAEQRRVRLYSGQPVPLIDQVYLRSDGTAVDVEVAASPIVLDGQPAALVTVREITQRKEHERKIARLSRIQAVLSGINMLIVRARDRDELFREACRIAVDVGAFKMAWIGVIDAQTLEGKVVASYGVEQGYLDKIRLTARDGTPDSERPACRALRQLRPVISNDIATDPSMVTLRDDLLRKGRKSLGCFPLMAGSGAQAVITLFAGESDAFDEAEMQLLLELAGNISFALDHIEKEKKLTYLAYYDVLTGLANRHLFLERVAQYMRGAVSAGHQLALFLIDLERFKNINDSLGRPAGDTLLKQVAEWLTHHMGDANLLARVGSDHFAAVLPDVRQDGDLARLLEKSIAALVEHPFRLNDAVFRMAAKVGVAVFPDDGADADTLFRNAEAALKKTKASGERYLFYTQGMTATVAGNLTLENQLRQALDNEEFVLHYQPKVNLASGKLTGVEALIRWNDPRTGLVAPGRFIPILEETGLIYEVGRWALHKAIEDYLRWRAAGLAAVRIAVNVSPLQLRNHGFIAEIRQAIGADAHAAAGLELEITESLIMEDVRHNIASLQAIRAMGVTIAIDDFGTGFSSLSYLAKLPVDTLKIDRSFVIDMTAAQEGLALVSTIISLAHALKLKVVAEGVETEEQSRLLRLLNCDEIQGYLFSKPVSGEIFEARFLAPSPAK
jgi:diguanylate cyclase (GGDEF)-like protein/PAS domain S-box-containing protein